MARVKDGAKFTVKTKEDMKKLVQRLQEDAQGNNEYTQNNYPSDEEIKLSGSDTSKILGNLEGFVFRDNKLNIKQIRK